MTCYFETHTQTPKGLDIAKLTFVRLISEWSLGGCEDPQVRAGLSQLRI